MKALIRTATHAGGWYPEFEGDLRSIIHTAIQAATINKTTSFLKSIIVPHAGYRFCLPTSAQSFAQIQASSYDRVIVIGPSHHQYFHGCGLTDYTSLSTPLGNLNVDIEGSKNLLKNSLFFHLEQSIDDEEHSIEMELPLIKHVFGMKDIKVLPIMVGEMSLQEIEEIGKMIRPYFEDSNSLFVISSDFCHWGKRFNYTYYNKSDVAIWESIKKLDMEGVKQISTHDVEKFAKYAIDTKNTICGKMAILMMMSSIQGIKSSHFRTDLLFYDQSSKNMEMSDSSVSYVAAATYKE